MDVLHFLMIAQTLRKAERFCGSTNCPGVPFEKINSIQSTFSGNPDKSFSRTPPERHLVNVWSPAKINPVLQIRRKRPDGFHELFLHLVPISLCDRLRFTPKPSGGLQFQVATAGASLVFPAHGDAVAVHFSPTDHTALTPVR